MTEAEMAELRDVGVVVLREVFSERALTAIADAAEACFDAIEDGAGIEVASCYGFSPFSYSVRLEALLEFGVPCTGDLMTPIAASNFAKFLADMTGEAVACNRDQSWVRKRFCPDRAPARYHPNRWHQDGGLGMVFPADPVVPVELTRLLTVWLPLQACGHDSPGLEFVRQRLPGLLHYTELDDEGLRRRFGPSAFWAPKLELGDGIVFLADSLHRTHVTTDMCRDRLSVEYRFFPVSTLTVQATTMKS